MPGSLPIPDPISNPLDCTTSTAPASVTVSKTDISTGPYSEGDTITYQVAVTNNSTTDLSNATLFESLPNIYNISDPLGLFNGSVCINAGFTSLITYDYVVTNDDYVAGGITNTATLTSTSISSQASHFTSVDNSGVMNISKRLTSNTIYTVGSTISYKVDVWNSGGSNVNNIKLTDSVSPLTVTSDLSGILGQGRTFIPGGAATVEYDYVVTAADGLNGNVTNVASITVQTGSNLPVVITDSTVTPLVSAGFIITKSLVSPGSYDVGDDIVYNISILNLLNQTVTDVTVLDDLSPITYVSGTEELLTSSIDVAPQESYFVRYSYTAVPADAGTTIVNTATLSASNYPSQIASVSVVIDDAPVWNTQDTVWETTDEYDWEKSYEDFA